MKSKSEAPQHIKTLIEREEKRLDTVVKVVKSILLILYVDDILMMTKSPEEQRDEILEFLDR